MAFPTIPTVAAGRVLFQLATSPSGTHTSPSLSSLTKNDGDLLIAIVIIYDGNSTNAEFSSWGGGFTEFKDQAGTATMGIGLAWKRSTGAETGTFTVTSADASANDSCFILLSIPGASAAPEAGSMVTGTGAAADPASFNPAGWDAEDTLWIAVAGSGEDSTTGSFTGVASAPANYGNYADSGISADVVGGVEGAVAFRQLNASSEDVGTFSVDVSNARNAAIVIAVRPNLAVTGATIAATSLFAPTLAHQVVGPTIASGNTLSAPTVSQAGGAQSVTSGTKSSGLSLFAPTAAYRIAAATIAATSLFAPTLAYRVAGPTRASGNTLFAPTVAYRVAGAHISATAVSAPTVVQTVRTGTIAAGARFAPTVTPGAVTVVGANISGTSLFAPTVAQAGGPQSVTGGTIAATTLGPPSAAYRIVGPTRASGLVLSAPTVAVRIVGANISSTTLGAPAVSGAQLAVTTGSVVSAARLFGPTVGKQVNVFVSSPEGSGPFPMGRKRSGRFGPW